MKVLVFDLDDTLYNEKLFVDSGFRAVSRFLFDNNKVPLGKSYLKMQELVKLNGRGKVFDDLLKIYNIYSKSLVDKCLKVYRKHTPEIELFDDAKACLTRFENYPIYIVTDDNKIVQKNKFFALKLQKTIKKVFITHNYGLINAKPSPYCFFLIAKKEKAPFEDIVYIGDNPKKDFVGIKPYGFRTIRLNQGPYKDIKVKNSQEAEFRIDSLNQITVNFIEHI
jgi:putative hydrolase of the HAD superfamily